MKIGQYCQRQRCSTSNWSNFGMLWRRAGLSATAGLSCQFTLNCLSYRIIWMTLFCYSFISVSRGA